MCKNEDIKKNDQKYLDNMVNKMVQEMDKTSKGIMEFLDNNPNIKNTTSKAQKK